ncbi:MAG: T9SS type A sorting domain-containing protein [Ignavibacteriaceae bacterium]
MNFKLYLTLIVILSAQLFFTQTINNDLYVSSRNTNSVKVFSGETGAYITDFVQSGLGGLNSTQEVAFGPDGHLYVSGRGNTTILKYDRSTGDFIGNFTTGYQLDNPTKMTFGSDGNLYVSQWGSQQNKVVRFNSLSGEFVDEFTSIGLNQGCGHAWDSSGNLYVANFGSADVKKFDTGGTYIGVFTEAGHLQGAVNLWFDGGALFVLDWSLGKVLNFNSVDGTFISEFISGLTNAEGVTFDESGNIYICDWTENRINQYDSSGAFIQIFSSGGEMQAPNSIVFGPVYNPTSVSDDNGTQPQGFNLYQNFPNPFNPTTKISFTIDERSSKGDMNENVKLIVYNLLGNNVSTLINDFKPAGTYEVVFDASGLSSGVYFYMLSQGSKTQSRKLVLLK